MNSRLGGRPISVSQPFATPPPPHPGRASWASPSAFRFGSCPEPAEIRRTFAPSGRAHGIPISPHEYVRAIMELETRKVQKLGYSSLGVSLPKEWAVSNGVRQGALVSISIEDDGRLRVRVGPFEESLVPTEATIDADQWAGAEALTRMITGNYIVGCNTIRVRSREEISPSQLQEIHEAVRGLTGLTIVNQGPKVVTIENFVEPTRFPIDGLLRRLHYLTSRMENLALGVLAGASSGNIEEVIRMESEVDRLYWLPVPPPPPPP